MDRGGLYVLATAIINQSKKEHTNVFVSRIYSHVKLTMRKLPFICRQKQFKYKSSKLKINMIKNDLIQRKSVFISWTIFYKQS